MKRTIMLGAMAGAAGLLLRSYLRDLEARPDRYPEERLRREPEGTLSLIERTDGTRLRALCAGEGPTVVLCHGYGVSLLLWNVVFDLLLEKGYRVICFDQRGHGRSTLGSDGISSRAMAGDYLAVLEHFDIRGGILVGHSMGGFLAVTALLEVPGFAERLRGLVLLATSAGRILKGSLQNRLQLPLLKHGVAQRIAATRIGGLLFGASLYGDDPSPAGMRAVMADFLRQDHLRLWPILQAHIDEDRYDRLAEIRVPTVVLCGRRDRSTPPWHSEQMARSIPGARLQWVDGAGYLLNWEAPEALVSAVESLLT